MITGIHIERLRGIHEGTLANLTPLTVLVGPSGAGKSTVLDALLIGVSGAPGDAIGRVVRRRAELPAGAPWLFERAPDPGFASATIVLTGDPRVQRTCSLSRALDPDRGRTAIEALIDSKLYGLLRAWAIVEADNRYDFGLNTAAENASKKAEFQAAVPVRLVEAAVGANHESLVKLYSRVAGQGGTGPIREAISTLLEGAQDLLVLTYDDGRGDQPILHVAMKDHTVPLAATGSGIYSVVRLGLELAAVPGGVVLVEEPEVHEHPAAIHRTARLLLAAARRGIQVIVSTHSLDLIDSLVSLVKSDHKEDIDRLSVIRVLLDQGKLRSSHFSGEMVVTARGSIEQDLR